VAGRGGELVLVEGGRLVSGTRLLNIVLKYVRRGRRVMPLRHGIHVVRVERRLVKQRSVILIAGSTGVWEERKVVIVEIRRQVSWLRRLLAE
jgi:hypothetical protein